MRVVSSDQPPAPDHLKPPFKIRPLFVVPAALILLSDFALSQVRGGYETFSSRNNAESWGLYDSSDGKFYLPEWDFSKIDDPEIYGYARPASNLSLFADSQSSNDSMVGDFHAERISGLGCDAYVDDVAALDSADFYFVSAGVFYFSVEFFAPVYFSTDGWDYLEVSFKTDPWFTLINGTLVEMKITDAILSSVTEVGVDFYSTTAATSDIVAGIDNFALIPEVIVPEVSIAKNGGNIELGFQRQTGQIYGILQSPDLRGWAELTGYSGITGKGPYLASDPIAGRKFFRLGTEAYFTPIPDIGPP